jgi:hypothetical protein
MNESLEFRVLTVLCSGTLQGSAREAAKSLLRDYHWHNSLHKALWDSLCGNRSGDPEILRQWLPAQMTRFGFPDVGWEELFSPNLLSEEEALSLMRRLVGSR